ncbi:MAG TPA: nucleotidyl transferase AbiEii/AbiGii toxin family protein [Polyangiaceae bacterium]|nr:nucleotidyl transferase AbiEii/AbiGii toxin family protein [Polyangiaceae bacterium]
MAAKRMTTSGSEINLEKLRRSVIRALAADDQLGELLVLKGGNALRLVYRLGIRTSQDLDYSIEGDLDPVGVKERIEAALTAEFQHLGYVPLDVKIEKKPHVPPEVDQRPQWGGWRVGFKLISQELFKECGQDIAKVRNQAMTLYQGKKSFRIDISRFEYVTPATEVEFEGFSLRVYSLAMIVYEKLRAICQQMDGYEYVSNPTPRPRDFVDICSVLEKSESEVLAQRDLLARVFEAKNVPLSFLRELRRVYEFHESDWQKVADELGDGSQLRPYFDRVLAFVDKLEPLWEVESPI